jgi:hypothetical protein
LIRFCIYRWVGLFDMLMLASSVWNYNVSFVNICFILQKLVSFFKTLDFLKISLSDIVFRIKAAVIFNYLVISTLHNLVQLPQFSEPFLNQTFGSEWRHLKSCKFRKHWKDDFILGYYNIFVHFISLFVNQFWSFV